jgi:hypothetical protein
VVVYLVDGAGGRGMGQPDAMRLQVVSASSVPQAISRSNRCVRVLKIVPIIAP